MEDNTKKLNSLKSQIGVLIRRQALTNSPEEKMLLSDQISKLRAECREINRKQPVVVPVRNAATVGDTLEAKLRNKNVSRSHFGQSRVII